MCIGSLSLEKMSQVFKKVFSSVFVWNTVAAIILKAVFSTSANKLIVDFMWLHGVINVFVHQNYLVQQRSCLLLLKC